MTDRLAAWLEELDRQPLPIPASHYAGLHAALSDSRRSLREIADQLQGSPTLALSICARPIAPRAPATTPRKAWRWPSAASAWRARANF